jgi:hypothetical protein
MIASFLVKNGGTINRRTFTHYMLAVGPMFLRIAWRTKGLQVAGLRFPGAAA